MRGKLSDAMGKYRVKQVLSSLATAIFMVGCGSTNAAPGTHVPATPPANGSPPSASGATAPATSALTRSASQDRYEMVGTFTLYAQDVTEIDRPLVEANGLYLSGPTCHGADGYSDFGPGMPVTVKNETGEIIGASTTTEAPGNPGGASAAAPDPLSCEVAFTVSDVPAAKFYVISIGHRGDVTESFQQLQAAQWHLSLTLGSQ